MNGKINIIKQLRIEGVIAVVSEPSVLKVTMS